MSSMPDIYAVIWNDFIPLSLQFESAEAAVASARDMRQRWTDLGLNVAVAHIRAVHVPAGTNDLLDLELLTALKAL